MPPVICNVCRTTLTGEPPVCYVCMRRNRVVTIPAPEIDEIEFDSRGFDGAPAKKKKPPRLLRIIRLDDDAPPIP